MGINFRASPVLRVVQLASVFGSTSNGKDVVSARRAYKRHLFSEPSKMSLHQSWNSFKQLLHLDGGLQQSIKASMSTIDGIVKTGSNVGTCMKCVLC